MEQDHAGDQPLQVEAQAPAQAQAQAQVPPAPHVQGDGEVEVDNLAAQAADPALQAAVFANLLAQVVNHPPAAPAQGSPWAPSHQVYTPDFKGIPLEGQASAERPAAVPLGKWLRLVRGWSTLHDNMVATLTAGHLDNGQPQPLFDHGLFLADPRRTYQDQYLRLMFENKLSPMVWNEVRTLPRAADMFGALVQV